MTVYELPLVAGPQTFSVSLSGTVYQMTVQWRATEPTQMPASTNANTAGTWALDIADAQGAPVIAGIPLVTGADLLAQYAYLGIPGSLIVQTDHDTDAVPTYRNLGDTAHLYWLPPS